MASGAARTVLLQTFSRLTANYSRVHLKCAKARCLHTSTVSLQKYFSEKHEWIDVAEGTSTGTVGITEYAQDKLGEVVYAQMPEVGTTVEFDGEAGCLESVKAASDVYSPVSGEVTEINEALTDEPGLINNSPYDNGWLFKVAMSDVDELKKLMNEDGYNAFLQTQD